jgi:hypothetical protein
MKWWYTDMKQVNLWIRTSSFKNYVISEVIDTVSLDIVSRPHWNNIIFKAAHLDSEVDLLHQQDARQNCDRSSPCVRGCICKCTTIYSIIDVSLYEMINWFLNYIGWKCSQRSCRWHTSGAKKTRRMHPRNCAIRKHFPDHHQRWHLHCSSRPIFWNFLDDGVDWCNYIFYFAMSK